MGAAALPLMIAGTLLQFGQQVGAGRAAARESELEAKQIELGVTQREADRKADLARAMASQTASAGARGVAAFEGSPLSVLQEDIRREEVATERDIFQSELAAMSAKARGKVAKRSSLMSGLIGLTTGLGQAAMLAPVGTTTAKTTLPKITTGVAGGPTL